MTHDLTTRLAGTLTSLESGWPIDRLNSARRAQEQRTMSDEKFPILSRLAEARDRVRKLDVPAEYDFDTWASSLFSSERSAVVNVLADQLALVTDCAAEIRQRDATIAELRGRVAALEAMTPGGVR